MLRFEFDNKEDIPEDLPEGIYTTSIREIEYTKEGTGIVHLKFIGEPYNSKNPQCIFPLTKHNSDEEGN